MGCGSSSVATEESRNSVDKPPDENNNARTKSIAKRSAKKSPQANNALVLEDLEDRGTIRLLLLGAAESGKTTLLGQIRMLYNQEFSKSELMHRRSFICANIANCMQTILHYMHQVGLEFANEHNKVHGAFVESWAEGIHQVFDNEECKALQELWNDPTVQQVYTRHSEYNLNDSTKYFMDSLDRIRDVNYVPTPQDMIMAYVPTIGIQNVIFTTNNQTFQLFDIGGQKIDRRKWAMMYDGIDAIFFCLAISEYDQRISESDDGNRLHDALDLLAQISVEPKFLQTPIFLFLNETDVFLEKLKHVPLEQYLSDYSGSKEPKEALAFTERLVRARCNNRDSDLYVYFTCFVNSQETSRILESVFDTLLKI